MTRDEIISEVKRLEPWFHWIDLGDGLVTKTKSAIGEPVEHPRPTWDKVKVCLPDDLSGKTVLDVGCNAGFYCLEMKRRGAAHVVGIDSQRNLIRQAAFVRDVNSLDIDYRRMSVYDLDPHSIGQFDVTLALGLLYHCKHLVMALEKLFIVTRELLILETAIYPPEQAPSSFKYEVGGLQPLLHPLAYVENAPEAKEAIYNWFLPGISALCALLKNIGFDEVEVFPGTQSDRAIFACRKSQPYPDSNMISYLGTELTLIDGPTRSAPGEVLRFRIQAKNIGYARWLRGSDAGTDRGSVHLVAHILGTDEAPLFWYHAGAFLTGDVAPGEAAEIEIVLAAPDSRGKYLLAFDMVSEHLAWFEDLGSVVLKHELIVD